jgi:hypothetical protein
MCNLRRSSWGCSAGQERVRITIKIDAKREDTYLDGKARVDGPFDSRVLGRAFDEVWAQQGPVHCLCDTGHKPEGHGEGTCGTREGR